MSLYTQPGECDFYPAILQHDPCQHLACLVLQAHSLEEHYITLSYEIKKHALIGGLFDMPCQPIWRGMVVDSIPQPCCSRYHLIGL